MTRDDAFLTRVFDRHWTPEGRDFDAAKRALYQLGVHDGQTSPRRKPPRKSPLPEKSNRMQRLIARALPFVRRAAEWKKVPLKTLINGQDAASARERQETYFLLRALPEPFSYPVIAAVFKKKDHSAVLRGCRKVAARIETEPGLADRLRDLAQRVGAAA